MGKKFLSFITLVVLLWVLLIISIEEDLSAGFLDIILFMVLLFLVIAWIVTICFDGDLK
jgi:hypothetical protein